MESYLYTASSVPINSRRSEKNVVTLPPRQMAAHPGLDSVNYTASES